MTPSGSAPPADPGGPTRSAPPAGLRLSAPVSGARVGVPVRCDGLVHIYTSGGTEVLALRGVDLDVDAGERVAILGPSGCGKSTLLNLLGGLLKPSAGQLLIDGADVGRFTERELLRLRAAGVGMVLQGAARNLMPFATPTENVQFAQQAVPRVARRRLMPAAELLELLGLQQVSRQPTARLSGGEQQRVALAVGVANQPGLLLADEPTSQLDAPARAGVLDLLDRVHTRFGTTVILVTHDPDVGDRFGRTVSMRNGRVGAEGRRGEQFAVVGKDGSIQLPDRLTGRWPPGTLVRVDGDGDTLHVTRR